MRLIEHIAQRRTFFHLLFPLLCFIFAKPSLWGLLVGAGLVILGEGIRLLSAGYIVKNELLTTSGPYAYTRNPLYLGSFVIGIGICFLSGLFYIILPIYLLLFALVYIPTIKSEEEFLQRKFGKEYLFYKNSVPAFLPLPKARFILSKGAFSWSRVKENNELRSFAFSLLLILLFVLKFFLGKGGLG